MKKLLLPLIIFMSMPFNTSCIKEITFKVEVSGEHCTWPNPIKKATMGRTYEIKLVPEENYELYIAPGEKEDGIHVETKNAGDITFMLKDEQYNQESQTLTIPASFVTSEITITAVGHLIEL